MSQDASAFQGVAPESAPDTGHPEIDAAVGRLEGLEQLPVGQHHDELTQVHEVLDRALNPEAAGSGGLSDRAAPNSTSHPNRSS